MANHSSSATEDPATGGETTRIATETLQKLNALESADLIEFVDDCIKHLRGMRIPFLSKYRERFDGRAFDVVPTREAVLDLF